MAATRLRFQPSTLCGLSGAFLVAACLAASAQADVPERPLRNPETGRRPMWSQLSGPGVLPRVHFDFVNLELWVALVHFERHLERTIEVEPGLDARITLQSPERYIGYEEAWQLISEWMASNGFVLEDEGSVLRVRREPERATIEYQVDHLGGGLHVREVARDGDLTGLGIHDGDVIREIDGRPIEGPEALRALEDRIGSGGAIEVLVTDPDGGERLLTRGDRR